jgi:hypothetical protein
VYYCNVMYSLLHDVGCRRVCERAYVSKPSVPSFWAVNRSLVCIWEGEGVEEMRSD